MSAGGAEPVLGAVTEPHAARRLPGALGLAAARPRITPAARDHAPLGAPPVPCTRPTGKGGILGLTPSRPGALAAPDARSPLDPAHAWGARVGRPPRSGSVGHCLPPRRGGGQPLHTIYHPRVAKTVRPPF